MNTGPGYVQTKIKFCQTPPFIGLGALGMWYSYCLQSEITNWQSASRTAKLGTATDRAAFCYHPKGYNIRRILSDGALLKVYDSEGQVRDDTLIPVALPGANLRLLELHEVVPFLKERGAVYCCFAINGLPHTGYVLDGHSYSATWSDKQIGLFFETDRGKNPNGKIIEPLPEAPSAIDIAPPAGRVPVDVSRIIRDTAAARRVKSLHSYRCQICGQRLALPGGSFYAEGHHIRPLGTPHDGPDKPSNILCLCPNHHAALDLGAIAIDPATLRAASDHRVFHEYIEYHNRVIHREQKGLTCSR